MRVSFMCINVYYQNYVSKYSANHPSPDEREVANKESKMKVARLRNIDILNSNDGRNSAAF